MNKAFVAGMVAALIIAGGWWYVDQSDTGSRDTYTYTNTLYGFSLQYPAGTEVREDLAGEYPQVSFWGDYGVIHVSPTYVFGYRDMDCPEPTTQKQTLAGRSALWRETCGVIAISFEDPPAPWKPGSEEGYAGNVIIVAAHGRDIEEAKKHSKDAGEIVSTFKFTE